MWIWKRKKEREKDLVKKEAEIQDIKAESLKLTTEATVKLDLLNQLIEKNPQDVTLRIFAATGGHKRLK